jgi:hypothetical protein
MLKKSLHSAGVVGYASSVTAKKAVIGFSSSNNRRTHRLLCIVGGFFMSENMALLLFGRAMWGAVRLAGPVAGLLTHMVPSFLRLAALGWKKQFLSTGAKL